MPEFDDLLGEGLPNPRLRDDLAIGPVAPIGRTDALGPNAVSETLDVLGLLSTVLPGGAVTAKGGSKLLQAIMRKIQGERRAGPLDRNLDPSEIARHRFGNKGQFVDNPAPAPRNRGQFEQGLIDRRNAGGNFAGQTTDPKGLMEALRRPLPTEPPF